MAGAERAISRERNGVNVSIRLFLSAWLLALPVGVVPAQAPGGGEASAPASRPAADPPDLEPLLRGLSQPGFKVRQEAVAALCELPYARIDGLIELYERQSSHEIRLGLRTAIEHVFFRKQLQGRLGFMGFALTSVAGVFDPKTGRTVEAILAQQVLGGFPAEKAGLRTGDLVLEFEGKAISELAVGVPRQAPVRQVNPGVMQFMFPTSPLSKGFTAEVSSREPGSDVHLRIARLGPDRELAFTLPPQPGRALEGAKLMTVGVPDVRSPRGEEEPRASFRAGLVVAGLVANSPAAALGLQQGDVILAVGRMPLSPSITPALLNELFGQSPAGMQVVLTLSRLEEVELTVTLGGRPVDRMNTEDLELAQGRFAEWWKEQTGEASVRTPAGQGLIPGIPRPSTALPDPTVLP